MDKYEILLNNRVVGTAVVSQCGLYTQFSCSCKVTSGAFVCIAVSYEDITLDLGICIREEDSYVLCKKVPTKQLGKGKPKFYIGERTTTSLEFIPLSEDAEFCRLHRLDKAKFAVNDGLPCLIFECQDEKLSVN